MPPDLATDDNHSLRVKRHRNYGRTASIYNLLSQCTRFGLNAEEARKEIDNIANVVRGWREHFFSFGVSAKDIAYIEQAFLSECFFFEMSPGK